MPRCHSCGEWAETLKREEVQPVDRPYVSDGHYTVNGLPYCPECFLEKRHGIVGPQGRGSFAARPGTKDDISPWQENAIREMEDG